MEGLQIEGLVRAAVALFVVVDPLGNVPVFMGLTKDLDPSVRRRALRTAVLSGLFLLLAFAAFGEAVLKLFSISLPSLKIAGGILLLIIAMKLLIYGEWREGRSASGSGAVPLGFPLLVGPGAITTTMVSIRAYGLPIACTSAVLVFAATSIILAFMERIYSALGESGSAVVARLMSIFIAAIAVQFVLDGILAYAPFGS